MVEPVDLYTGGIQGWENRYSILFAFQMLIEPGHDLDEITRKGAVIELFLQYAVPTILAGPG